VVADKGVVHVEFDYIGSAANVTLTVTDKNSAQKGAVDAPIAGKAPYKADIPVSDYADANTNTSIKAETAEDPAEIDYVNGITLDGIVIPPVTATSGNPSSLLR
jgi:hypothetical protein